MPNVASRRRLAATRNSCASIDATLFDDEPGDDEPGDDEPGDDVFGVMRPIPVPDG